MQAMGEADWSKFQTKAWVNHPEGGKVRAWVLIVAGNSCEGKGFVLQCPLRQLLKVGQRVCFKGGNAAGVRPTITKIGRALTQAQLRAMAASWLQAQLTFDPKRHNAWERWVSTVGLYW